MAPFRKFNVGEPLAQKWFRIFFIEFSDVMFKRTVLKRTFILCGSLRLTQSNLIGYVALGQALNADIIDKIF